MPAKQAKRSERPTKADHIPTAGNVATTVATLLGAADDCWLDSKDEPQSASVARAADHLEAARDVLAHAAGRFRRLDEIDASAALEGATKGVSPNLTANSAEEARRSVSAGFRLSRPQWRPIFHEGRPSALTMPS